MLEGRHVIGLFFLMLLFSGVFFTLGYVMGRNQFEGQVRAETTGKPSDMVVTAKSEVNSRQNKAIPAIEPATDTATDAATPPSSDWEFYHAGEKKVSDDHLRPVEPVAHSVPKATVVAAAPRNTAPISKPGNTAARTAPNAPMIPHGAFSVQVAALTKQADALAVAASLQKKKFIAYVVPPQTDKYFRVQVGPYPNQKAADAARKSLESAGFKAIVKRG